MNDGTPPERLPGTCHPLFSGHPLHVAHGFDVL